MSYNPLSSIGYYTGINQSLYWLYAQSCDMMQSDESDKKNVTQIADNLYISDYETSFNKELLKEHGITHIISCVYGLTPRYPDDFKYKNIPLIDNPSEPILVYFDDACEYINNAIKNNGNVLVHCMYGASRSVTIIAAYIINKAKGEVTPKMALKYLRKKRKVVNPNEGYIDQLEKYYEKVKNRGDEEES